MPRAGPKKVHRYSLEFKLKAVKLSQLEGVDLQAVADASRFTPSCCRAGGTKLPTSCCVVGCRRWPATGAFRARLRGRGRRGRSHPTGRRR